MSDSTEAMALGVPVIATDCGGSPEAFTHGVEGLLVPPKDGPALGAAMARMLKDTAERRRMARASAELARKRFDARLNASRMETIYEELIAR